MSEQWFGIGRASRYPRDYAESEAMTDHEMAEEAIKVLMLLERNYDPELGQIVVSGETWLELTRYFRLRMNALMRRGLPDDRP
jgi:hypothetical protein